MLSLIAGELWLIFMRQVSVTISIKLVNSFVSLSLLVEGQSYFSLIFSTEKQGNSGKMADDDFTEKQHTGNL